MHAELRERTDPHLAQLAEQAQRAEEAKGAAETAII